MRYIALLRGINIGGRNKVEMPRLRKCFESLGYKDVLTYINSGNVIFSDQTKTVKEIREEIERAIKKEFKLEIKVMLRSGHNIKEILENIPSSWKEEAGMCPYIPFLWEEIDTPDITKQIGGTIKVENIKYIPGALLWNLESKNWSKDSVYKFTNGKMSKNITVRNINTLIKLVELI